MTLPLGVSLVTARDELVLTAWLKPDTRARVLKGLSGFGLPPVSASYSEGAGDGATFKGAKVLPRDVRLPINLEGAARAEVSLLYNRLAVMLDPEETTWLRVTEPGGRVWQVTVVRVGGGDYEFGGVGTNGKTSLVTELTLRAGAPFWTSTTPQTRALLSADTGRGLIPGLAELKLTSTKASGVADIENTGSAKAKPVWTINGPASKFTATGPRGEVLEWDAARDPDGAIVEGEVLILDSRDGSVTDGTGADRFEGLSTAPQFWAFLAGTSSISVVIEGAAAPTRARVDWYPRSWVVF